MAGAVDAVPPIAHAQPLLAIDLQLMRIQPDTLAVEVIVDGLATDPTSFPVIAYDEDNGCLYTMTGRNLLQVEL